MLLLIYKIVLTTFFSSPTPFKQRIASRQRPTITEISTVCCDQAYMVVLNAKACVTSHSPVLKVEKFVMQLPLRFISVVKNLRKSIHVVN